jgi:hypothetical protein
VTNLGTNFTTPFFRWVPTTNENGVMVLERVAALLVVRPRSSLLPRSPLAALLDRQAAPQLHASEIKQLAHNERRRTAERAASAALFVLHGRLMIADASEHRAATQPAIGSQNESGGFAESARAILLSSFAHRLRSIADGQRWSGIALLVAPWRTGLGRRQPRRGRCF